MADDFPTGRDPMRFLHGLTLTGMATLCLCCADSKPASIAFTAPPPLIVSGKIIRLEASVANEKGEPIAGVTAVEVDERIVSEPLRLADGARRSFKLQPGDYLVSVDVQADFKAQQGVTVTWEGAACEGQPERQSHRVRCRVNEPATVTVANPKQFGLGAGMTGSLAIYRVPSQ